MDVQRWYQLAAEYETVAKENMNLSGDSEDQVTQYYQLIDMAVTTLTRLKNHAAGSLTLGQDLSITMRLVRLLVEETWEIDLAENYLSSLLERLQNQPLDLSIWNQQNLIQYWLVYEIPMKRTDPFHIKIALRNYQDLIDSLQKSQMNTLYQRLWISLFDFVASQLYIRLHKFKLAQKKLEILILNYDSDDCETDGLDLKSSHPQWYAFLFLNYINLLLQQRLSIPDKVINILTQDTLFNDCTIIGPILYSWKLLLQLVIMINKDQNITPILNDFKIFFQAYKDTLSFLTNDMTKKDIFTLNLNDDIDIKFKFDSFLSYKDIKLILLFLQSVSYLVNCYDKNAQFSTKFLPKMETTLRKLLEQNGDGYLIPGESLNLHDENLQWYNDLLQYCKFYQIWEKLLLDGGEQLALSSLLQEENDEINDNELVPIRSIQLQTCYKDLIHVIKKQLDIPFTVGEYKEDTPPSSPLIKQCLADYNTLINRRSTSIEVKLMSLLNSYILTVSQIDNETTDQVMISERQTKIMKANTIWEQIDIIYGNKQLGIHDNPIWVCTIIIIWIIAHFEPFSWNPLPSNDQERNSYLERLKQYYINNKIISEHGMSEQDNNNSNNHASSGNNKYLLKKAILLRVLINYLGAKLFETDLETLCQISLKCFKYLKQDKHLINIRYIIGLWHLMNCTVAMKPKEVTYTTAKLEQLVKQMIE